jgi:hypothetical protein
MDFLGGIFPLLSLNYILNNLLKRVYTLTCMLVAHIKGVEYVCFCRQGWKKTTILPQQILKTPDEHHITLQTELLYFSSMVFKFLVDR